MNDGRAKRVLFLLMAAAALWAACGPRGLAGSRCTLDQATGTTVDREPFLRNAYGSRWNLATNRIAYMQPNGAGYYRLFALSPDGGRPQALSEGHAELPPNKHQGMPYWHPSGRYLVFESEKADWKGRTLFGIPDYEALPGFGRHSDLWLIAADGSRSWQLTNGPNTLDEGVLIPVFSPDGRSVAWSERQPGGKTYALKVADFVETPEPHLENTRSYEPGGTALYEPGSFTSDSRKLAYMSNQDVQRRGPHRWSPQIYLLDLASGKSTRLTTGNDYNEHPVVVSTPSGDWIVYMSTKGVDRFPGRIMLGTDWYAMRVDGSDAKRLTWMNVRRKDNPQNTGDVQVATTVAISPSGDFMLGDVQDSLVRQTGMVRMVRFTCP